MNKNNKQKKEKGKKGAQKNFNSQKMKLTIKK